MHEQRQPNPLGKLLSGGSIIAISAALGRAMDIPNDPVAGAFSGFMLVVAVWLVASGVLDLIRKIALRIARKRAEKPTGVYGEAKLATPQDCADAGLTKPNGLFLGMLRGIPIFFNGKAHLITVAPARQGKGVTVVIPNLLHYAGSVFVTDPKGELAAVTAWHRRQAVRAGDHLSQSVGTARPSASPLQPAPAAYRDGGRSAPPS